MQEKTIIIYRFSHLTKNGNGVYFINIFKQFGDGYILDNPTYLKDNDIPYRKTKKGQAVNIQAITQLKELDPTAQFIQI